LWTLWANSALRTGRTSQADRTCRTNWTCRTSRTGYLGDGINIQFCSYIGINERCADVDEAAILSVPAANLISEQTTRRDVTGFLSRVKDLIERRVELLSRLHGTVTERDDAGVDVGDTLDDELIANGESCIDADHIRGSEIVGDGTVFPRNNNVCFGDIVERDRVIRGGAVP
jgi:hypothetical protein